MNQISIQVTIRTYNFWVTECDVESLLWEILAAVVISHKENNISCHISYLIFYTYDGKGKIYIVLWLCFKIMFVKINDRNPFTLILSFNVCLIKAGSGKKQIVRACRSFLKIDLVSCRAWLVKSLLMCNKNLRQRKNMSK